MGCAHGGFEVELVDLLEIGLPFLDEPTAGLALLRISLIRSTPTVPGRSLTYDQPGCALGPGPQRFVANGRNGRAGTDADVG
jgi:hypothetical protein